MTMSRLRLGLQCVAMAVNALCAGGVYSFPLISPALVEHLRFSQPQLTTIALAGMVGQYPFAALVGKVLDSYGARTCSLVAAMTFSIGFGLFAAEISGAPETMPKESVAWAFRRMVVYFAMVGLGTVFSYFSVVFSATLLFPRYVGIASGTSMALFGCSPLVISVFADKFFTYPASDPQEPRVLNVTQFLTFLVIITGTAHILGSLILPGPAPPPAEPAIDDFDTCDNPDVPDIIVSGVTTPSEDDSSEVAPLLLHSPKNKAQVLIAVVEAVEVPPPQLGTTLDLLRDPHFWVLAGVAAIILGCSEMVITNMGSLFQSLPVGSMSAGILLTATAAQGTTISTQVQLLSLTNTLIRLIVGPIADWAAPVPISVERERSDTTPSTEGRDSEHGGSAHQHGLSRIYYTFPRTHYVSRIAFLLGASTLLLCTFLAFLSVNNISSGDDIRAFAGRNSMSFLSVGVGITYGSTFTVLPGILSSIYGPTNVGRNFGIISYAPFVGTSVFSYIYAMVADAHSSAEDATDAEAAMCRGPQCWRTTFAICIVTLGVASCASGLLWRRWRGRV